MVAPEAGNFAGIHRTRQADLFLDEVYVFTPNGKIIELPSGATPVDFAYAVHTHVGDTCVGCEINGQLESPVPGAGEWPRVSIVTAPARNRIKPGSISWLPPRRAAPSVIFSNQQHDESVELSKRLLDQGAVRFGTGYRADPQIPDPPSAQGNRRQNF
ncbi:MAG: bifunctional (p)ppGpp synthetase/guanosine-3',5'-bis(diphosphate) 3'-pyrophosphohydrolase [Gammaproteobacteria bacterium]|nr:bifunctional (p)ppGpp synthetase/guanosine-3',5'-bis(diphosphate) 3'-pyrophosphohydrolase [Gammaproteobacteria bacterium]